MGPKKAGFQWDKWDLKTGYKTNQWQSRVSAPSCAFCNKPVFPAEEIVGAGQKYHRFCLKCIACNTLLNSGNINSHEKKIYCVSCYRRQFGPRGIAHGLGLPLSLNIETPPTSPSLRRFEICVDSQHYQRMTSIGSSTSRTSSDDDSRHTHSRTNNTTYVDDIRILEIKQRSSTTNLNTYKMMSISGNICPRCSKTVYSAEGVKAVGKSFHKRCYTCAHCKGGISGARFSEHNGELYDNNCYHRLFGPKGILSVGN
ncbi:unnamed protein product [Rotaria socialis]|uniref:Cysteine-rich protein 1 n=1 Tax=Rotaria socialis TaxID=392032 RepID=A0A818HUT8_9BILA|nr:unnamed protein product [Rotaria socialis]CAF3513840.1 unnamed protein product [Rotaria socialis]CAF3598896.1 unnamed protein product [Rotaria socialis]CAF4332556.1 unnamed protein product [Rotaria socialis]CAF4351637.1 unnamed protein product [Rotaria socialis]